MGREKPPHGFRNGLLFWGTIAVLAALSGWAVHVLPYFSNADF